MSSISLSEKGVWLAWWMMNQVSRAAAGGRKMVLYYQEGYGRCANICEIYLLSSVGILYLWGWKSAVCTCMKL